ncbi:unnamed protein product [Camellia sinensis]
MENKDEDCPQLLDLIPKNREWIVQRGDRHRSHGSSEEKKLELRLGPPGEQEEQDWTKNNNSRERDGSLSSVGYFSNMASLTHNNGGNRVENGWINNQKVSFSDNPVGKTLKTPWSSSPFIHQIQTNKPQSSQTCGTKGGVDLQKSAEKKAFSANTAVPNSSQKRTAPAQVVGWPPIRSFRKNLASSSSSKQIPESQNVVPDKVPSEKKRVESFPKGFFVKINMDGVPIGRKVDLKAYDSYEKLSSSVDELFRGLLAAQRNSSAGGIQNKHEGERAITDLLDGSGEYTLVYEDNEGDRMLVGDVPWHMFLSTVKRLRVLKSSDLSTLRFGSKQEKIQLDAALK